MLVVVSDTHGSDDHRLRGRTLAAVREADVVVHAGDFTEAPVLDAFQDVAPRLLGVVGNNDDAGIRDRLPGSRTLTYAGLTVAVTHGDVHKGSKRLSLFGREREADLVVFGHSHRPGFEHTRRVALLNPGSHAEPRGRTPAHAELEADDDGVRGRLVTPDGDELASFRLPTD
jgi:hypothetical protein